MIKHNMSGLDRIIRIFVSLVCIYLGFFAADIIGDSLLATIIGVFGVFNIFVVAVGICPVYFLAGINTCKRSS